MSRAIASRVEKYIPPSAWGEGERGQPRTMFNYGDGLVAVLAPGRKGGKNEEVYRFKYCINGRPSTLHIGYGGPDRFESARKFADIENEKVKVNRANNSSLEVRAKRIGKEQKPRKREVSNSGFRSRDDLIKFISFLEKKFTFTQLDLLVLLHISTLLDLWQLLNMKYSDVFDCAGMMSVDISLDFRLKKAKFRLALPNYVRNLLINFASHRENVKPDDDILSDLRKTSIEDFQFLIGSEMLSAGVEYRVGIDSLRDQFVSEFSEFGLLDKSLLRKFFGHEYQLSNMRLMDGGLVYVLKPGYEVVAWPVTCEILNAWSRLLLSPKFGNI